MLYLISSCIKLNPFFRMRNVRLRIRSSKEASITRSPRMPLKDNLVCLFFFSDIRLRSQDNFLSGLTDVKIPFSAHQLLALFFCCNISRLFFTSLYHELCLPWFKFTHPEFHFYNTSTSVLQRKLFRCHWENVDRVNRFIGWDLMSYRTMDMSLVEEK